MQYDSLSKGKIDKDLAIALDGGVPQVAAQLLNNKLRSTIQSMYPIVPPPIEHL